MIPLLEVNLMARMLCVGLLVSLCLMANAQEKWTCRYEMDAAPALGGWFGPEAVMETKDGVLRILDPSAELGSGACYHVEWQAASEQEAVAAWRMKVVSAEGEAGVAVWISNGMNEEGVQFLKDGLNLAFAKDKHALNTTEYHDYRVTIKGKDLKLYVDEKLVVDATGRFTQEAHKGRSQLSFGSVSSTAKGESLWEYVRFVSPMRVDPGQKPPVMEQISIYEKADTYAVFPGVGFDPETGRISAGFRAGGPKSHIDSKGAGSASMVSVDGGKTWKEGPGVPGKDFTGPNGRLIRIGCKWWQEHPAEKRAELEAAGYDVHSVRAGTVAICAGMRKHWSDDGGKTWQTKDVDLPFMAIMASGMNSLQLKDGTILFPTYGYQKRGQQDSTWLARSTDYGETWQLVHVATHPNAQMPLNEPEILELKNGRLLIVMRTGEGNDHLWQATSDDGGATWKDLKDTGLMGHPPDLLRLADGRILLTYGYRHAPFGVRAAVSEDEGETWKDVWTLRDDGGGFDLGYPHSVQTKDGTVVTVYYFMKPGGMQHIAATRWQVP